MVNSPPLPPLPPPPIIMDNPHGLSHPDLRLAHAGQRWLAPIQAFFPGVDVSHVLDLAKAAGIINEFVASNVDEHNGSIQTIIDNLLGHNGNYPKAQAPPNRAVGTDEAPNNRPPASGAIDYMDPHRPLLPPVELEIARKLLCNDFVNISAYAIDRQLREHRHVLPTYINLLKLSASSGALNRLKKARSRYPIGRSLVSQRLQVSLTLLDYLILVLLRYLCDEPETFATT